MITAPKPREGVEDHVSNAAEEFLDLLSPRNSPWRDDPTAWVYRGQADAEWRLQARGVRERGAFAKFGITKASCRPGYVPSGDSFELRGLVDRLLEKFRAGLDRAGLIIPSPSPEITRQSEVISNLEPPREVYPLMALAQHHGLPTLLLDWSRRAWVAAYFAAVDAADPAKRAKATHLAVWAIKRGDLLRSTEGPNFYEAPGGTNPNLRAQSGLFSYIVAEDSPCIEEHNARLRKIIGGCLELRRACLSVSEAPKLLRLLSYEGITGASMFPGADGVVRAMRETALWDRFDEGTT